MKRQPKVSIPEQSVVEVKDDFADSIVIGESQHRPAIRIVALTDDERFRRAKKVSLSSGASGRLNALMQAVPSLLVADSVHGRKLMEVVINGDLVRASAGEGYRAFALGLDGKIVQNATLFDPTKLNELIDGAAVWQVASIVVAQKHLADISAKLELLAKGIDDISGFLEGSRRSIVTSTYDYLNTAAQAIQGGEFPDAVRIELESCERQIKGVQNHLWDEFRGLSSEDTEHSELFGTEELKKNLLEKFTRLEAVAKDIGLCIRTRILGWYVMSLFPGQPVLKAVRKSEIARDIAALEGLKEFLSKRVDDELARFKSMWTFDSTLVQRKAEIMAIASAAELQLVGGHYICQQEIDQSAKLLERYDKPTHLLFEIQNGVVSNFKVASGG